VDVNIVLYEILNLKPAGCIFYFGNKAVHYSMNHCVGWIMFVLIGKFCISLKERTQTLGSWLTIT